MRALKVRLLSLSSMALVNFLTTSNQYDYNMRFFDQTSSKLKAFVS